jgi:hypothetical protein
MNIKANVFRISYRMYLENMCTQIQNRVYVSALALAFLDRLYSGVHYVFTFNPPRAL